MLRRLWYWLVGAPPRPRLFIERYGSVFVDGNGKYEPAKVEEFAAEFEAAGVDTVLWPEGLVGLYDDGRGQVIRVGGRDFLERSE